MTKKPDVSAWIGGVVILVDEPQGWGLHWDNGFDRLMDDLERRGCKVKQVQGPLINGIVAITLRVKADTDFSKLPDLCARAFKAVMVKNGGRDAIL